MSAPVRAAPRVLVLTVAEYLGRANLPRAYPAADGAVWADEIPEYMRRLLFSQAELEVAQRYLGDGGRPYVLPGTKVTPHVGRAVIERVKRAIRRVNDPRARRGLAAIALRVQSAFAGMPGFLSSLRAGSDAEDVIATALAEGETAYEESREEARKVLADQALGVALLRRELLGLAPVPEADTPLHRQLWDVVQRVRLGPDRLWTSDDALVEQSREFAAQARNVWNGAHGAWSPEGPDSAPPESGSEPPGSEPTPAEVVAAPQPAPTPLPALEVGSPESARRGLRVWKFRLFRRDNPNLFAQLQPADWKRVAGLAGFDPKGAVDRATGFTPLMDGSVEKQEPLRVAFEAAVPNLRVEVVDLSGDFAFGRTRGAPDHDLPELKDYMGALHHATRSLGVAPDGARLVAVARGRVDWQAARWGGSWEPFDPSRAATDSFFVGDAYGHRPVRRMSDGTWVTFGTHAQPLDSSTLTIYPDRQGALEAAENRLEWPTKTPHPEHRADEGPPADRVRVVGWKDGGPEIEFSLLLPRGYPSEPQELSVVVRGHVPSAARRVQGSAYRRYERVEVHVAAPDGSKVRLSRDEEEALKRLLYEAVDHLPEDARQRPKGRIRTPAPFEIGEHVRFVGAEERFGLAPGAAGLVEYVRRPKDPPADLSEIVFPEGATGHVEVVAAGT